MAKSVEYLGHVVDALRLHTTDHKVKAVLQALQPRNQQDLRLFSRIASLL